MQFSDTTNKNGLIQDCEILLGFQDAGISGNATLLKQFTSLINNAYLKTIALVLASSGTWEWDDSNYSDFPIATATIVNNQQDYTLPVASSGANASTLLKIQRIEVMDINGDYVKLDPIDETDIGSIGLNEFMETAGLPKFYREIGNSIELYPKPSTTYVTASAGLKIYFQRTPDLFTSSDTIQEPGIARPFHRLISLEASGDYAASKEMTNVNYILRKIGELTSSLEEFNSTKNKDKRIKFTPKEVRSGIPT